MANTSSSGPFVSTLTWSPSVILVPGRSFFGIRMRFAIRAMMPIAAMPKNATRQPNCCPTSVPIGTPVTVAMVSPVNMMEMALARLFGGTRSAAMVDPMDMKTPCAKAEMTRAMSSSAMVLENAAAKLPSMNTIMMASSNVLRFMRDVSAVRIGAPNMTPTA